MKSITEKTLTGERACYGARETQFKGCIFEDGESPLKECRLIFLEDCLFGWKYPLWYCDGVDVINTKWLESGRSGVWYTKNIHIVRSLIGAPKQFRHSRGIVLEDCSIPNAEETLWHCEDVTLKNVTLAGDYFGFHTKNVLLENVQIDGNYCFDGGKNIVAKNCVLNSKDAFWNAENVTLTDCVIDGEYLAWNTKNITFVRCKIISHQGLCYIDGLRLKDCGLYETDLCFERCKDVEADITTEIVSIKNPYNGYIRCKGCGEIVRESEVIDPAATLIEVNGVKV